MSTLAPLALLLAFSSAPVTPQVQLNGPLPRETIGGVHHFKRSPDGATYAYAADERFDDVVELFTTPADGSAAPIAVSGALTAGGDIGLPSLSNNQAFAYGPDGSWLAFVADATVDGRYDLFRVPVDGSAAPTLLSGALVAGGDVDAFLIAPDGASIVFRADAEVDERFELYRVPADGSTARTKLSPTLVSGGDVSTFLLGPQDLRAYFLADAALDDVNELHSVPIDGSLAAVRLNDALAAGRGVLDFRLAPDETRVAYRADAVSDDVFELFAVPADRSSAPVKLSPTPVASGDVFDNYALDPTSTRVGYRATQDTNGLPELYSAPLDGSAAAVKLHPGGSLVWTFCFTLDGAQVLFGGDLGSERGLFRVPATGGTPVLRSAALLNTASEVEIVQSILPSSDGSTCVYVQNVTLLSPPFGGFIASYENLFAVEIASGAPLQLTSDVRSQNTFFFASSPVLTEDGATVLYLREGFQANPLYAIPVDASSPPLVLGSTTVPLLVPNGTRVAHLEGQRLTSTALDGSDTLFLSAPPLLGAVAGDVTEFEPTPDGLQVVYQTSFDERLYVTGVAGSTPPRALELPDLPRWSLKASLVLSDDSQRAAYLGQSLVDGTIELFSAHLRSSAAPAHISVPALNGPTVASHPALQPRFTPDGARLVFAAGSAQSSVGLFSLHVVPSDGGVPATRLNGSAADGQLWDGGDFLSNRERAFALTRDGTRVVYAATTVSGSRHNLFSVPLDQSAPPVQLSSLALPSTSVYGNWELSPDGSRVLYMADQEVRFRSELYSVPVDGSAPPVKLNPPLVSGGLVGFYGEGAGLRSYVRMTPDGARAVYLADQESDNVNELYSVPLDASAPALKLSGTLIASGDVQRSFQLDPSGTLVFYRADAATDETFELFVAPVDGSAAPLKLSGTLVAGGDVTGMDAREGLVHIGSGRAVYVADAHTDGVLELYSVPIDGSAAPLRLNAALPSGGNVDLATIQIAADGQTVLYRADQATNDVFELWRVPIDGSASPVRINLPLPSGGDVELDARFITLGNRVLYRADQDVDNETELFTLRLEPRTRRTPMSSAAPTGTVTHQL